MFQMMRVVVLYPSVQVYKKYKEGEGFSFESLYTVTTQKLFLMVLPWSNLARSAGFLFYWFSSVSEDGDNQLKLEKLHMILNGMPQYLFLSVHMMLILFWYVFFQANKNNFSQQQQKMQ